MWLLQLGLEADAEQPHPTPVRQLPNIMSIALGTACNCMPSTATLNALISWCVKADLSAQLSYQHLCSVIVLREAVAAVIPVLCSDRDAQTIARQSCCVLSGGLHSIAVSGSGQILTWGANQNGLLGLGSSAQQNVPTPTPVPDVFAAHVRSFCSLSSRRYCCVLAPEHRLHVMEMVVGVSHAPTNIASWCQGREAAFTVRGSPVSANYLRLSSRR